MRLDDFGHVLLRCLRCPSIRFYSQQIFSEIIIKNLTLTHMTKMGNKSLDDFSGIFCEKIVKDT